MGKLAKKLKDDLIRVITEYPDIIENVIIDDGDLIISKPKRTPKKFTKDEIIKMQMPNNNVLIVPGFAGMHRLKETAKFQQDWC